MSRSMPSPPRRPIASAATSATSCSSATPKSSSGASIDRTFSTASSGRTDLLEQIQRFIDRHPGESGVIYVQ